MNPVQPSRREVLLSGVSHGAKLALAASAPILLPNVVRARSRPNILFVAIDDLNDWIGPLDGYAGVKTPNLDRLAKLTRVYRNAYSPAPACSAARSSVMFGVQPFHSGVYTNFEDWDRGSELVGQTSLPRFLKDQGYLTIGVGKVFHDGWRSPDRRGAANDPHAWSHFEFCRERGRCEAPSREEEDEASDATAVALGDQLVFGPTEFETADMPDVVRAKWFCENVLGKRHDRPFFGAIGLSKPHLPFTVPQKFFDLYRPDDLHYPPGVLDPRHNTLETNEDVRDLPPAALDMLKQYGARDHRKLTGGEHDYWPDIVRSYLATISFTDHCVGLLLDAWLKGPNADDTVIVLWSDHGWQLGEKLGWRKFTLWERATRVPLMIGGSVGGRRIRPGKATLPVSTLALYPTIARLAAGEIPKAKDLGGLKLDGEPLDDHLFDRDAGGDGHALSTWMLKTEGSGDEEARQRHFSIRTRRHRLIAYGNGDRELYDHSNDPYEFRNLLAEPTAEANDVARRLARKLPEQSDCVRRAARPA
jgi:arylsulfatase A-like enzyme